MLRYLFPAPLLLAVLMTVCGAAFCLSACSGGSLASRLTGKTDVLVRMEGDPKAVFPLPVRTRGGTQIGEAVSKTRDEARDGTLWRLVLDSEARDSLRERSVFYLKDDESGQHLVYDALDEASPKKTGELVFLGFSSHESFLFWRTRTMATQKLNEFLDMLDKALREPGKGGQGI